MMQLEQTIIHLRGMDEFDPDRVWKTYDEKGIVCLRGLIDPAQVGNALENIKRKFSAKNDRKRPGGREGYNQIKKNYQRLLVGTGGGVGVVAVNPRLFRCFYNPLWEPDIYEMHGVFRSMTRVRNRLLGEREDFAVDKVERGVWSACRIQHYPTGGGFLVAHTDEGMARASTLVGHKRTANIILLMTKCGKDFSEGGGFIEIDGSRIYYEHEYEIGDLVLYDDLKRHGVEDVDPYEPLDLASPAGRYTAFVSLFVD